MTETGSPEPTGAPSSAPSSALSPSPRPKHKRSHHKKRGRPPQSPPRATSGASVPSFPGTDPELDLRATFAELEEAADILEPESPSPAGLDPVPELGEPGAPLPAPAPALDPAELGTRLHRVVFAILAARLGAHWALSLDEEKLLGETSAPLMAAVMERVSGLTVQVTMYAVVVGSIVLPRLSIEEKHAQEELGRAAGPMSTDRGGSVLVA